MKQFSTATFLDRAILAVSPARGLNRIQARVRANVLMNYDAAGVGRRLSGWKAPGSDADAASMAGRSRLRNLSRDMMRNAPFAVRAKSVVVGNVVGAGIMPSIDSTNKKFKEKAIKTVLGHLNSKDIDRHGEHDICGLQTVVMNSVFESGEVLVIRRGLKSGTRKKLPLQIEVLEVDHLNSTILTSGKNEVRDGVEYDADGVIVAYHLYEQHPGAATRKITLKTNRVAASEVIHVRRLDRAGQSRGVPWLAPVMLTLGELRDYQEAQILKQKISALMVGVVELPEGVPASAEQSKSALNGMSPGALVYTEAGSKMVFSNPPSVDDYEIVMRMGLMAIAMGIGITYESVAGDLSRVNFSSSRVGRLEMDKNIQSWQTHVMLGQFCEGVGQWCQDAYRLIEPRPVALKWTPPVRALIDPNKEVPAILKKVKGGLTSLQREQRGMGLDPDEIQREREEDAQRGAVPEIDGGEVAPSETKMKQKRKSE